MRICKHILTFLAALTFVDHGFGAVLGGVHDPLDFLVVDEVQQVRAATGDAEHGAGLDAFVVEHRRGAAGGVQFVSEVHELANERDGLLLVFVLERDEDVALARDLVARCQLALEVGKTAVAIDAHDFAGRLHFRRKRDVDARELDEREDGFLDAHVRHMDFFGEADLFEGFAEHAAACITCKRNTDGLGNERHGAGGARNDTFFVGVPAHICAVGLYCKASRAHLRHARAALATKLRYASLVPKGSLSLTQ